MSFSLWFAAAIFLIIVEILTPGVFFFACLAVGALFSGIAVYIGLPLWMQWVVFPVISVLFIYFIRPLAKKLFLKGEIKKSNVDELIGQKVSVTELIDPPGLGRVKISGEIWLAQAEVKIEIGSMVEVLAVEGTKLKVKKTS